MRHNICNEEELRDAMHALYPHRHETSDKEQKLSEKHRNTRWKHKIHNHVPMSHKHAAEAHSHPCIERIIPNYYESPDIAERLYYHHLHQTKMTEDDIPPKDEL